MYKPAANCTTAPIPIGVSLATVSISNIILMGISRVKDRLQASSPIQIVGNMTENYEYNSTYNTAKSIDIAMMANIEKINQYAEFENDWDGYDAVPYTHEAIDYFTHVIEKLNKQPDISPTAANSIILKYTAQNGDIQFYNLALEKIESVFLPGGNIKEAKEHLYGDNADPILIINKDMEKIYGST